MADSPSGLRRARKILVAVVDAAIASSVVIGSLVSCGNLMPPDDGLPDTAKNDASNDAQSDSATDSSPLRKDSGGPIPSDVDPPDARDRDGDAAD